MSQVLNFKYSLFQLGGSSTGLGLGTQAKPCFRIVTAMFFIAFLSIFYFFSDITTAGYIEFMRKTGMDSEFNFEGPVTCKYNKHCLMLGLH